MVVPTSIIVNINNGLAGSLGRNTLIIDVIFLFWICSGSSTVEGFSLVVFLVQVLPNKLDSITIKSHGLCNNDANTIITIAWQKHSHLAILQNTGWFPVRPYHPVKSLASC